jgi:tRNA(fMet)-specific endonuclease VapC
VIPLYSIRAKNTSYFSLFSAKSDSNAAITIAEMEYGASKSMKKTKNRQALVDFISGFEIIPFELKDAEIYGIIRAELERKGKVIGAYDMQLAAQALSRNYIFITNNTKEFSRIGKLKMENWV